MFTNIALYAMRYGVAVVLADGENSFYVDDEKRGAMYSRFFGEELVKVTRATLPLSLQRTVDFHVILPYHEGCPDMDGILTSNDLMAATVVRWCLRHGIRIPEQLKIVGYDDTAFTTLCPIRLTSIHQPIAEIARYAVDCVSRRASGETVPVNTVFPVRLVARETT